MNFSFTVNNLQGIQLASYNKTLTQTEVEQSAQDYAKVVSVASDVEDNNLTTNGQYQGLNKGNNLGNYTVAAGNVTDVKNDIVFHFTSDNMLNMNHVRGIHVVKQGYNSIANNEDLIQDRISEQTINVEPYLGLSEVEIISRANQQREIIAVRMVDNSILLVVPKTVIDDDFKMDEKAANYHKNVIYYDMKDADSLQYKTDVDNRRYTSLDYDNGLKLDNGYYNKQTSFQGTYQYGNKAYNNLNLSMLSGSQVSTDAGIKLHYISTEDGSELKDYDYTTGSGNYAVTLPEFKGYTAYTSGDQIGFSYDSTTHTLKTGDGRTISMGNNFVLYDGNGTITYPAEGSIKDVYVLYVGIQQSVTIRYVDGENGDKEVGTEKLMGRTGESLTPIYTVPKHYDIVSGNVSTYRVQPQNNTITVKVQAHHTSGTETKTITRTIIYTDKNGQAQYKEQSTTISRSTNRNDVSGNITYGDWSTGTLPAFTIPEGPTGYVKNITSVPSLSVNGDSQSSVINVVYSPIGAETKAISVPQDTQPEADKGIKNPDALPQGTQYSWQTKPDTSVPGSNITGNIQVNYPGGVTKDIAVPIHVTPVSQLITTPAGQTPDPNKGIKDADKLPKGTQVTWETTPDTSMPGSNPTGTIKVTYPDGKTDTIDKVPVHVTPVGQAIPVQEGQTPEPNKGVKDADKLPEGTQVEWVKTPDTSMPGSNPTGTIKVTYPDGKTDTIDKVPVHVTPVGQAIPVPAGQTPDPNKGIKDADKLPKGTQVTWETTPDTSMPGSNPTGTIKVTYPDGKTDTIDKVPVHVTPVGQAIPVPAGQTPDPNKGIKDADKLPKGTKVEWSETPNTSMPGSNPTGTIKVTYPDGKTDTIDKVPVHVTPVGQAIPVPAGQTPDPNKGIKDADKLPKGTKVEWSETPNTSIPGSNPTGTIKVTYPDGKTDTIDKVPVHVTPVGQAIPVPAGQTPDPNKGIKDADKLPKGTQVTWETTPDTSMPGSNPTGTIKVTYPDGKTDTIDKVPVHVIPVDQAIPVPAGQKPDPNKGIKDADKLPEGTQVEWVKTPDTSMPGSNPTGTIKVTYPDGKTDTIGNVPVHVTPVSQPITTPAGQMPEPTSGIKDADKLPKGTQVEWEKTPDTSMPGSNPTGTIKVTYPDGKTDTIDKVPVHVIPVGQAIPVPAGQKPDPNKGIKDADKLPKGTKVEWSETPDTSMPGSNPTGTIKVTYPDGKTDTIGKVPVHVTPVSQPITTPAGQMPEPTSGIKDADKLPKGTKVEWSETPDTSMPGSNPTGTIKVTYPDGKTDTIGKVPVHVTPVSQPITTPAGQMPEPTSGIKDADKLPKGTKVEWSETPDTSMPGSNPTGTIKVTYPDGKTDTIGKVPVHVTPVSQPITTPADQMPDPTSGIKDADKLPKGTQVEWEKTPDTSMPGSNPTGTIKVTYPDGKTDTIGKVPVHVTPVSQPITTPAGQMPEPTSGIKDADKLPKGTKVEWSETPNTSMPGSNPTGTIKVTYPDGKTDTIGKVPVHVTPVSQPITTPAGQMPEPTSGIKDADKLPKGTKVEWSETPDTSMPGSNPTGTIKVTYPDGKTDTIDKVPVHVTPVSQPITTPAGQMPEPTSGIKDADKLPKGTKVVWVKEPDTKNIGTVTGMVKIMYPNGQSDLLKVQIKVTVLHHMSQTSIRKHELLRQGSTNVQLSTGQKSNTNAFSTKEKKVTRLPQTGDKSEWGLALLGSVMAMFNFRLIGARWKQRHDN